MSHNCSVSNDSGLSGSGLGSNCPNGPGPGQEPPSNPTRVTSSGMIPGPDIKRWFFGRVVPGLRFYLSVVATSAAIKYM
jgi:hypothetical protein